MEDRKTDRRINRTRRLLREALLSLVLEKGFDAVTIEDITRRADVGRTTFYLHYKDKEDLLLECINAIAEDLLAQVSHVPTADWQVPEGEHSASISPHNPILLVFTHAALNRSLYLIIMRGGSASQTQTRLRDIIANAVGEFLHERLEAEGVEINMTIPMDMFANYFAGALLGILNWWLEMEMPYTPYEITRMFQKLFFPGARNVLGLTFP